jgi:hypothetical protein
MDLPTELSLEWIKEWWFVVLVVPYMVIGYNINREYDLKFNKINDDFDRIEDVSELQRINWSQSHLRIENIRRLKFIEFWLFCITLTTLGILVTLLKQ